MSLTVKHLNSDASFLLTFQPISPFPPSPGKASKPFTILLDPWLSGPSKVFHPKFSISKHKTEPCVSSLTELPEPDLVIISQDKTDHCHKATLTQLPQTGGKTIILAEATAAKVIKRWKYFDTNKLATLPKWEKSKNTAPKIYRIPLPSLTPNGLAGEVTVAFLAQKSDITRLHSAIGITYRPPTDIFLLDDHPMTPPDTPRAQSFDTPGGSAAHSHIVHSTLSVIYSPHGCNYQTLAPYITSHLVNEAALPLTALLHCFDKINNPWWLGGNVCAGFPGGLEIAQNLCARAWISAHDGDKDTTGIATKKIVVEKYEREEVESVISPRSEKFPNRRTGTEAVVLKPGEEIQLSHAMDFGPDENDAAPFLRQQFTNFEVV